VPDDVHPGAWKLPPQGVEHRPDVDHVPYSIKLYNQDAVHAGTKILRSDDLALHGRDELDEIVVDEHRGPFEILMRGPRLTSGKGAEHSDDAIDYERDQLGC
jgi:hypothetical protein